MGETLEVDICVIGGGLAGLSVAAVASQLGVKVALIEQAKMGGDCLNYGCVPSKALIAAARAAHEPRRAKRFGIEASARVDYAAVAEHVRGVIGAIAPNDSVERFTGLGVRVIEAPARFIAPDRIEAGGIVVRARRFVIATGSSPAIPPIPGLDKVPYLTNETIFDLALGPEHLIVIGAGPIGCELAQAHRRLGARVTVLELFTMMPKDDPELVDFVRRQMIDDGVEMLEGVKVVRVDGEGGRIGVVIEAAGKERRIAGSHILVAAGRRPNVEGLNLEAAGIAYSPQRIDVDARLRTSNRHVFAIGDVTGGYQFTHVANHHAGIVIRNALFRLPARADRVPVPWVTFTEPELANVGLTEAQAMQAQGAEIRIARWPFDDNDRARTERESAGLVKIVATPRGRILGAGIVGARAGELIWPWVLAMQKRMKLSDLAAAIAPYPTLSEASKRAAASFYAARLFTPGIRTLVRFLARFG